MKSFEDIFVELVDKLNNSQTQADFSHDVKALFNNMKSEILRRKSGQDTINRPLAPKK